MTLVAKPVVADELWIVTDGDNKVGNVRAEDQGFAVILDNKTMHVESTVDISRKYKIKFETAPNLDTAKVEMVDTSGYPLDVQEPYNTVYDAKRRLHLYTPTAKSRCYQAAGWFAIHQDDQWQQVFCPKYIYLQRYRYVGPEVSQTHLERRLNNIL